MTKPFHDFLHDLSFGDLHEEVVRQARRCLLDLIGVAAGGSRTDLSAIIRNHARSHFAAAPDGPGARMLFDGRRVGPVGAALAGGMTIDALDGHDGHRLTKGHVGCGMFPALLALCEAEQELDGRQFLAALVIGYEIGTRAGIAMHRTVSEYHTSGAWVAVACAALGARILKLDEETTRQAIGIAEYHGPRSQMMRCIDHPTMLKDGSGWGAMAGVSAAYLARERFTGAPAVTVERDDVADLWSDLGTNWLILDQYFKPYPVCRWAQPAVEAVLALKRNCDLAPDAIAAIDIVTFHEAKRLATVAPSTTEEAQYSLPFAVAAALARGTIAPDDVGPSGIADPTIRRLAALTTVSEEAGYSAAFPARRIARLRLRLKTGDWLESAPTEARGDPERPLSDAWIGDKFDGFARPVLGAERAATIKTLVAGFGDTTPLPDLLDAILAAP